MMRRNRKVRRIDSYQVCVTIIEAKHLEPNGNPMVVVRVGNRKKKTMIRKTTDNPYYNEYFVFDLSCNMESLLSTRIEIAVYLCGRLKRSKFYGNIVFEVATVWDQPDHQYYHKWAMLTNPRDLVGGPKGYVKCNIAVHAKGEKFKMPPETEGDDDIEGNLLLPFGDSMYFSSRQHAHYSFTVHRAEDLPDKLISRSGGQCCVRVSFAGMKASTRIEDMENPRFNERLVFNEMFPPLCHRARIAFKCRKSGGGCRRNESFASYLLNLKAISNSGEHGFLPTFGPSFLHLYAESVNANEPIYRGRLLLSLRTEIERIEAAGVVGVHVDSVPSIIEGSLWEIEEYLLVGVLYDICMIDRSLLPSGKSVSFEISLGNAGNQRFSSSQSISDEETNDLGKTLEAVVGCASQDSRSESLEQMVISLDGRYNCVSLGAKKPCVFVKSCWPNTEWRMRNTNRLSFIADYLEGELERLETLAAVEQEVAYIAYNGVARNLKRHCNSYLHSLHNVAWSCRGDVDNEATSCMTNLDKYRLNYCKREIEGILERLRINGELPDNRYFKIAMTHAYGHLRLIRKLCQDPQHSLPDVFVWMISGSRRLAFSRVDSTQLVYAEELPERGSNCGKRLNLFLERPEHGKDTACRVELFFWLGNAKYAAACWSVLPPGYVVDEQIALNSLDVFPSYLEYEKPSKFQLRAHIFQGRFEPGMDSSGLLDPMLRVIFQGYTMTTKVIKQTLDPFWDQTLVFPAIDVHGMREHVKNHPPKVILEAFDMDYCNRMELYGRCAVTPLVKLNTETYSPPDFPKRLRWHKFASERRSQAYDSGGAVLAAFDLIEVGDKETVDLAVEGFEEDSSSGRIYRIPEDIRPKMANYRLEVIFWGVRDMKRVGFVSVLRPMIVVECAGVRLESQIMENAKKFPNFHETRFTIDFEMAEEVNYYPPITIKAYDSRGFGRFKYLGMHNTPTIHAFIQQLTTKDDYERAIYHSSKKFRQPAHCT